MCDFIDKIIFMLTSAGLLISDELKGCSITDIDQIELKYNKKLPNAYKCFMQRAGKNCGRFLSGTDILFPDILQLREQALRLLKECKANISLSSEDFVFAMHQGYQFLFFKLNESDDPPIFLYVEGNLEFEMVANSFSEWLVGCAQDEIDAANALNNS